MSQGEETMVWACCLLQEAACCLLPVMSREKERGTSRQSGFDHFYTWSSLSPTRTMPSEDVKVIKMGIARGPLKLCQNQKSFKIRFN